MKLSASINFFNGEELLWQAVVHIRPLVEHLSIVYQKTSNWGEPLSSGAEKLLERLSRSGLVDDFYCYEPSVQCSAAENEFEKRRIGLNLAIANQATHFLLMDADEFYVPEQFIRAKKLIEDEKIAYSCVRSYFYIHQSTYRSELPDTTNICFIAKIDQDLIFEHGGLFPIDIVDPTRRLTHKSGKFYFFGENEICMHHMNFVRNSFNSKLKNTSSAANLAFIKEVKHALETWQYPSPFVFPHKPTYKIIKVADIFNLASVKYFSNEYTDSVSHRLDRQEFETGSMKKILITNNHLKDFTGSEIVTLELAKEFLSRAYEVTVGTFKFDEPLKSEFEKIPVNVINLNEMVSHHYDLVWAHHFTTLDELLIDIGVTADKIIFSSLSPFEPLETPPLSINKVSLCLANSAETKNELIRMGIDSEWIHEFPNPAPDIFFAERTEREFVLKKIAVVSNHVPIEVKEAIKTLKVEGFEVALLGVENEFTIITPDVLDKFDAVITIGKTVQYCLAMGIPVYCYDKFGGPGWIKKANIELARKFNFSGRCVSRKLISADIVTELISGFNNMSHEVEFYKSYAAKNLHLTKCLNQIEERLSLSSGFRVQAAESIYHFIGLKQRQAYKKLLPLSEQFIQLYFDFGYGFSEEDSDSFPILFKDGQIQYFSFNLRNQFNLNSLRLDLLNDSCVVQMKSICLILNSGVEMDLLPYVHSNAVSVQGNTYFFNFFDPQIYFPDLKSDILAKATKLVVRVQYLNLAKEAVHVSVNQIMSEKDSEIRELKVHIGSVEIIKTKLSNSLLHLEQERAHLDHNIVLYKEKIGILESTIKSIYNSKSWKITMPLRKMMNFMRSNKKQN